jgi:hypothetical protein
MLTRRTGPDRKEFVTTRPATRPPDKIRKRLGWALALALRPGSSWSRCGSAIHQRGRLLPTPFAITPTLRTPPLFALRAGPIVLTAMPTSPVPGRLLASCTAITTLRLTRVEPPFTALQKTAPPPKAPPRPLINRPPTWILRWAHGRLHSRRSSLGESVDSSPRRSCSRLDNSLHLNWTAPLSFLQ